MRPEAIVFPSPALDKDLRFRQRIQHLTIEQLIPELSDEGFDVAVFPRAPGLDEECGYAKVFEPVLDRIRREFRAVVRWEGMKTSHNRIARPIEWISQQLYLWEVPVMTQVYGNMGGVAFVAIDIAKKQNAVLIQPPDGARKKLTVTNDLQGYRELGHYLKKLKVPCKVGFEATGNYHRTLAYYLLEQGFDLELISSVAAARTREAMFNSWDKNDPKDAQVILYMLQTGLTQTYHDPLAHRINDIQELSKTYCQVSLRKTRVQHSIMTHYLPLYFPEAAKYFHTSRAEWFTSLMMTFPNPAAVLKHSQAAFIKAAQAVSGRKVNKAAWLKDFCHRSCNINPLRSLKIYPLA
jgi:hypothetical protein